MDGENILLNHIVSWRQWHAPKARELPYFSTANTICCLLRHLIVGSWFGTQLKNTANTSL